MKLLFFAILFIYPVINLLAQKPALDSTAIANWQTIDDDFSVSDDGSYLLFKVRTPSHQSLIIQSTNDVWKEELSGVEKASFSSNSKKVVFSRNDTLFFFSLLSNQTDYVSNISNYEQPDSAVGNWLAYRIKGKKKELVLLNLITEKKRHFFDIDDYKFNNKGSTLLIKTSPAQNDNLEYTLQCIDLKNGKTTLIWTDTSLNKNREPINFRFDTTGSQLTFIVKRKAEKNSVNENSIWYFNSKMKRAVLLVDNQSLNWGKWISVSNTAAYFSLNGQNILFRTQQIPAKMEEKNPNAPRVDVWSYKDSVLQSKQLITDNNTNKESLAVINIINKNIVHTEGENERLSTLFGTIENNFSFITNQFSITEPWWKTYKLKSLCLVSLKTGLRKMFIPNTSNIQYSFSPNGKYLIYFDPSKGNYFSYNLTTSETINISAGITSLQYLDNIPDSMPHYFRSRVGIGGWLKNDAALLIYDNFDIWKIDPSNKMPPLNITNGYGQLHHIKLRLLNENPYYIYTERDTLLLTAFNTLNKNNGFYSTTLTRRQDPILLTMGPFLYYVQKSQVQGLRSVRPLNAKKTGKWILIKQTASEAPNFYLTTDFKSFKQITNLQPQEKCNWLTTELISWKKIDGSMAQGILYKPENFDSTKKYPVIFNYYEEISYNLHQFPEVGYAYNNINIPWFVSRGYLVFTPDIKYHLGKIGESTYNAVVSAAQYLSHMPWVDPSKLGLSGHSFGGFETNYLVTHSNIFTAALSAAGSSDLMGEYGSVGGINGSSFQYKFEAGQFRIGFTPWERPDLYIENSPIFKADHITTPVLIMHNKGDDVVPWSQSLGLYMAMRRFAKPVWMLQYDDGNHGITEERDAKDYTMRITQFFDYYLKDAPPPKWMTEGIPAKMKGIETGYELDNSGKIP